MRTGRQHNQQMQQAVYRQKWLQYRATYPGRVEQVPALPDHIHCADRKKKRSNSYV